MKHWKIYWELKTSFTEIEKMWFNNILNNIKIMYIQERLSHYVKLFNETKQICLKPFN